MPAWTIDTAEIGDAHTLSLVGGATFLETFADVLPGEDIGLHVHRSHSAKAYAEYLRAGARAWLATLTGTGTAVGYALCTTPDLPVPLEAGDIELKRIYLLSRFHGAGIGRALLDAAIADAERRHAPRLLLGVYHGNTRAIGFYRAMGFETVGTRQFQVGDGTYDDLILARTLAPAAGGSAGQDQ